jgi:hypothetical protein
MNVHNNARLTPRGRERIVRMVESGHRKPQASARGPFGSGLIDLTVKNWRGCRIARPRHIGFVCQYPCLLS